MTISPDLVFLFVTLMALFAGYPVGLTLGGISIVFAGFCWWAGVFDAALFVAIPSRLFGIMTSSVLIAIPLFVIMGMVLEKSGLAENMFHAMARLLRKRPGGLPMAVTMVGMLMAASTGIVGASVVTLGLLALPTLLKSGVAPARAAGTIAAVGTLGQIIPPSIVLIVLGDQMSSAYQKMQVERGNFAPDTVSVADLFAGALLPGLLLVCLYLGFQFLTRDGQEEDVLLPAETAQDLTVDTVWEALATLLPPLVLIVLVLGSVLAGGATPAESASLGAVGAVLLAAHHHRRVLPLRLTGVLPMTGLVALIMLFVLQPVMNGSVGLALAFILIVVIALSLVVGITILHLKKLLSSMLDQSVHLISMIFLIVIGASLFSLVFRGLGGDHTIAGLFEMVPGGTWGALLFFMGVLFLLGFFLEFIEITYIVVPLVVPVLLAMPMSDGSAMSPVWLGVLIALNLQTSFLTPPFGVSLFYLRSVTPSIISTGMIYRGVVPFVCLQLLALAFVIFFPFLATWLPEQFFMQ